MKNKWLITGVLSAGLVLTAAPAAWADALTQNLSGDVAMGSGVVGGSADTAQSADTAAKTDTAQSAGTAAAKTDTAQSAGTAARTDVAQGAGTVAGTTIAEETVSETDMATGADITAGKTAARMANTQIKGDEAAGSGVVSVPGVQQNVGLQAIEPLHAVEPLQNIELPQNTQMLQDAGPQGELNIDRTIGKNFIKQPFMECIGRSRSQVEAILGTSGETEETEDYAVAKFDFHINYELGNNEDVRIDYKNDIAVRIFGTNVELLNFEKEEYSLSEIDAIFQVNHVTLEGNTHFWHLQDDPDITLELLDNYAFINAY